MQYFIQLFQFRNRIRDVFKYKIFVTKIQSIEFILISYKCTANYYIVNYHKIECFV